MIKRIYILFFLILLFGYVQAQVIQLRKPVKGDVWPAFTVQRIQWTSANIDNIKIESSLDSGKTWTTIVGSYPASAEYYDWEVPNKVSDSCFIRVTDIANPGTLSTNYPANPFIIPKPGISLDPLPSTVYGKSVLPIPWTHSGIKKVNVYLSYSGKSQFTKIADTVTANNGFYIWIVKDTSATNCYVRVEDATNVNLSDTSDLAFSIKPLPQSAANKYKGGKYDGHATLSNLPKDLKLISPNNKDSLVGSMVYRIKWKARNIDQIKLEYTLDNGSTWLSIQSNIPSSAEMYDWKVPNTPTILGRVRVTDISDTITRDISDSLFVIRKKELKLLFPTVSAKLYKGSVWPVSWVSIGVSKIRLKYLPNNTLIADSVSATNEMYNWVPNALPDSFRIIIQDLEDTVLTDTTGYLKAYNLPTLNNVKYFGGKYDGHASSSNIKSLVSITYPTKKLSFSSGSSLAIQWTSVNIDKISVLLSTDSMKTWSVKETSVVASTGTYSIRLPNTTANYCFLKLINIADSSVFDISDSSFSIIPKQLKNTTDSITWKVGCPKMISWESVGVDSLNIAYRTSANGVWNVLNKSYAANAEAFYWVVPAAFDSLWIKLQDVYDTSLVQLNGYHKRVMQLNTTIADAKYKGGKFDGHSFRSNVNKIIIRKPDANEVVVSGTYYTVNWATINVTDSVNLQFSVDSGKTWIPIGRVSAVNGAYTWLVPVTLPSGGTITGSTYGPQTIESGEINSSNCLLRAVDQANGNEIVGKSTKTFTIKAGSSKLTNTLQFTKPNDMVWPGGTAQVLKATSTSGRNIKYYIVSSSSAQITNDTLIALKPGKITVGAYSLGDSIYYASDTITHTICINPAKPVISVKDSKVRFCKGDSATISGPNGFSYKWTSGDTLQNLVIKSSKNILLQVSTDGCSSVNSDTLKLISDTVSTPIVSDTAICLGKSITGFKATASNGNTLKWYGTNQTGGTASGTSPAPTGTAVGIVNYYVSQVNSIGCESERAKIVFTVNALPDKPVITWKDTILSIPSAYASYQWLLDNSIVPGATSNTLRPTNSGNYKIVVKNTAGCADTSAVYTLTVTGITVPQLEGKIIKVYPNPTNHSTILDLGQTPRQPVHIKLLTISGSILQSWYTKERMHEINLSSLISGEYLIETISGNQRVVLRIVKID